MWMRVLVIVWLCSGDGRCVVVGLRSGGVVRASTQEIHLMICPALTPVEGGGWWLYISWPGREKIVVMGGPRC